MKLLAGLGVGLHVALGVAPATARADPEAITLREAVRITIERNPGLSAIRIDRDIAGDRVMAARGAQDWLLGASARWDGTRTRSPRAPDGGAAAPTADAPLAPGAPVETGSIAASASLLRPLPGGGSIELRGDGTFARTLFGADAPAPPPDAVTLLAIVRQPLLRGWGGDRAPAAQLARTRAACSIAQLEATAAAAAIVRDVVRAYGELRFARDELAIRRASLALAREQLRVTRARVASGRISGSEALAVGQAIALREDEVAQADATLAIRSLELAQLLGRAPDAPLVFEPTDPPAHVAERDLARELAAVLERSPELAAVRARGKAAAIEVEVTANGMLPALDVTASAGFRGTGPAGRLWDQLTHARDLVYSAGLELTIPLGNRAASGTRAAAQRAMRRARLDEHAVAIQIKAAIVAAVTTMQSARRRITVLDDAVRFADQAIDAERVRWEEGKSTNYDVMKRQAEREDSALRRARAQADLLGAEAALDAVTGAILPRHGVTLAR